MVRAGDAVRCPILHRQAKHPVCADRRGCELTASVSVRQRTTGISRRNFLPIPALGRFPLRLFCPAAHSFPSLSHKIAIVLLALDRDCCAPLFGKRFVISVMAFGHCQVDAPVATLLRRHSPHVFRDSSTYQEASGQNKTGTRKCAFLIGPGPSSLPSGAEISSMGWRHRCPVPAEPVEQNEHVAGTPHDIISRCSRHSRRNPAVAVKQGP
ncbi:hypothetical protein V8F06_007382 [Rhypophila decipiens]